MLRSERKGTSGVLQCQITQAESVGKKGREGQKTLKNCGVRLPRTSREPAIDVEEMEVTRKPLAKAVWFRPIY